MSHVMVSGGFDPVHIGHVRMFKEASSFGKVIVIANNDNFLINKKGYVFMPEAERIEILKSFRYVEDVFLSIDRDETVRKSIEEIWKKKEYKITAFCNGGDRVNKEDIPESKVCQKCGIEMIFNVGGHKIQSSSNLVDKRNDRK